MDSIATIPSRDKGDYYYEPYYNTPTSENWALYGTRYKTTPSGTFTLKVFPSNKFHESSYLVRLNTPYKQHEHDFRGNDIKYTPFPGAIHGLPKPDSARPSFDKQYRQSAGCLRTANWDIDNWVKKGLIKNGRRLLVLPENPNNELIALPNG